jgi:predicted dehydrogenase
MPPTPRQGSPRVALIGVSGYGSVHYSLLRQLHTLGEIVLTAVAIIDPEKEPAVVAECRAAGCEVFADYGEMLRRHRGRLELCSIPTGIPWHTRMTLAALEAGANVLVEKPLAATLAEVEAIRAAEARHARVVMLGFQYHYCAENIALKADLIGSAIGTLRRIRAIGLWPRGADYYSRTDWAGRIRSGPAWVLDSPISNAFAHHLSLALYFAGGRQERSAAPVRVAAELYRAQPIENFDTAALRVATDTAVEIRFYASHSCRTAQDPEIVLEGDKGRVVWRHGLGYRVEPSGAAPRYVPLGDERAARLCMFRTALRRLADPGVFVCGTDIAREHTRCIQAAQCTGPARDVPGEWIGTNGGPGQRQETWVVGIEETMRRAFEGATSLAEAGCPWAGSPLEVQVANSDKDATFSSPPAPATKAPINP